MFIDLQHSESNEMMERILPLVYLLTSNFEDGSLLKTRHADVTRTVEAAV
jgi:hypothetical protein